MTFWAKTNEREVTNFRAKLAIAIMLVISGVTGLGIYLGQARVNANAERDLRQKFQAELSGLDNLQELRHAALAERCRVLAEKPRIHAALEDNALDLLYPSAKDELRDLMEGGSDSSDQAAGALHARFCRFLDGNGAVLSPPSPKDLGALSAKTEAQLALKQLPGKQQIGYLSEGGDLADETVDEVIAVPIFSTETGEVISALVAGFKSFEIASKRPEADMKSGLWTGHRLPMPSLSKSAQTSLSKQIANAIS